MTETTKRRRRTNAEILEDLKKERAEREAAAAARKLTQKGSSTPTKRVRRTRAQIDADKKAEADARERLAQQRAEKIPAPKQPQFKHTYEIVSGAKTFMGEVWGPGERITIEEGTAEFEAAFDKNGNFVFGLSEDEQKAKYGEVRYREVT